MKNSDNMAFCFIGSGEARFFCMNGAQQYCPERTRGLCKILKTIENFRFVSYKISVFRIKDTNRIA